MAGFFSSLFDKVASIGTKIWDTAKVVGPAVFQGVKKGIAVGKEVVKIGKGVLNAVASVPVIGAYARDLLGAPIVDTVDNVLNTAGQVTDAIEKVAPIVQQAFNPRRPMGAR